MKNAGTYVKYYVQTCKNMIPAFYKSDERLLEFWWDQPLLHDCCAPVNCCTPCPWCKRRRKQNELFAYQFIWFARIVIFCSLATQEIPGTIKQNFRNSWVFSKANKTSWVTALFFFQDVVKWLIGSSVKCFSLPTARAVTVRGIWHLEPLNFSFYLQVWVFLPVFSNNFFALLH